MSLRRQACGRPVYPRLAGGMVVALAVLLAGATVAAAPAPSPGPGPGARTVAAPRPRPAASGPAEHVRATIEAATAVLANPGLRSAANQAAPRRAVRKIIRGAFAFEAMARKARRPHWAELGPAERQDFLALFATLFEHPDNRVALRFLGESRTIYRGQARDTDYAVVHPVLLRTGGEELPVDYHLTRSGGRWAMSDVIVDGVSIAANYRAQFHRITRTSSCAVLLEKMRAKVGAEEGQRWLLSPARRKRPATDAAEHRGPQACSARLNPRRAL